MIVKAIWEFDVDDSEMDGKCVDIKGLCEDLTRRELDYCLKHNQLNADDFQYECHPELLAIGIKEEDYGNEENTKSN